jgi:hypothetical protein
MISKLVYLIICCSTTVFFWTADEQPSKHKLSSKQTSNEASTGKQPTNQPTNQLNKKPSKQAHKPAHDGTNTRCMPPQSRSLPAASVDQEPFSVQKKRHTLDRLAWSDMFETFLANK